MKRYEGGCHCGRVRFVLSGPPKQSFFCHCSICRRTTGAPYVMVGFWDPDKTEIVQGAPLDTRETSSYLTRHRCPDCGAAVLNTVRSDHMHTNNFMLALLDEIDAAAWPTHHCFYADRVIDVNDELPKFDKFKWLKAE